MEILRLFFSCIFMFVLFTNFSTASKAEITKQQNQPSRKFQLAYTTTEDSNEIITVDLQTGKKGIPLVLENQPKSIIIPPNGQTAYILLHNSREIIPIDLTIGKTCDSLILENIPLNMVVSTNGKVGYIIYESLNYIHVLDLASGNTITQLSLEGFPSQLLLDQNANTLYVTYTGLKAVSPIDISTLTFKPCIILTDVPTTCAITLEGILAYVGENSPQEIALLDIKKNKECGLISITTDLLSNKKIHSIHISADSKKAYLTLENSNEIISLNLTEHSYDHSVSLDHKITNIAIHPKQELIASFSENIAPAGQASSFDATTTEPFKGKILDYSWNFGDGHVVTSGSPRITHTFDTNDQYDITLTVTESLEDYPLDTVGEEVIDKSYPLSARATKTIQILKI